MFIHGVVQSQFCKFEALPNLCTVKGDIFGSQTSKGILIHRTINIDEQHPKVVHNLKWFCNFPELVHYQVVKLKL